MNQDNNKFKIMAVVLGALVLVGVVAYVWIDSFSETVSAPAITSITPDDAAVGTEVSIRGSGFTPTQNSLQLFVNEGKLIDTGFVYVNNLVSPDGQTLSFVLPESFEKCNADKSVCAESVRQPVPGQMYEVTVINANGESNRTDITIVDWEGSTPAPMLPGPGQREQVTIMGEIACLPKKGTGAQTMECAIGLRGTDGKHYSLSNLLQHDPEYKFSIAGVSVVVSGGFSPGAPAGSTYDIAGSIEVTSIKEVTGGSSGATQILVREGEQEGSFLMQKINRDTVEGLWYESYPVASSQGTPRTLRIGDDIGYACAGVSEKLTKIDFSGKQAMFTKIVGEPTPGGCPICLAEHTLIDTPTGQIPVERLEEGMAIWTVNDAGARVSAIVLETAKTPVPAAHQVVHLVLDDGRELFVSPGHPLGDGRTVGELSASDPLDGAQVKTAELVSYQNSYTYDVLPSGGTGLYWADGIVVGSTLR